MENCRIHYISILRCLWEREQRAGEKRMSDSPNHLPHFLALSARLVAIQIRLGGTQLD